MKNSNTKVTATLVTVLTAMVLAACSNSDSQSTPAEGASDIVNGTAVKANSEESASTVALYYPKALEEQASRNQDMSSRYQAARKPKKPKTPTDPAAPTEPAAPSTGDAVELANFCTGTLISEDVVMTAAHCFADFGQELGATPSQLKDRVVIGFGLKNAKSSTEKTVQFRKIASFIVNPQYVIGSVQNATKVAMHDVALIRLESAAPKGYVPATLVTDKSVLKKGLTVTLVGFGLLSADPMVMTTKMMEVDVQVDNPAVSATQFTYKVINGKSSCSGDSGGPAYVAMQDGSMGVVGITSWGDQTCEQIGAYTSVPAMASWIQSTMNTL